MSFADKVVLVTGASSGIGAATAILFAKEGANVAIVARTQAKLEAVAKKIEAHGVKALIITADLSKEAEVASVIPRAVAHFGRLDVLVNNAGKYVKGCLLNSGAVQAYDEVMNVNVRAAIQLTSSAAPHLVKSKGNVVNISSASGDCVARFEGVMPYSVSKAALNQFTRCAALELAAKGIRVNTVSPGPVDTEFWKNNGYSENLQFKEALINRTALGFMAEDVEVADVVLFLASDKARSITGSKYLIDNGCLLKT